MAPASTPPGAPLDNDVAYPIRPDLWLLDPGFVHLNHGSYGAVPVPVLDARRRASEAVERSPERFYRADLTRGIEAARHLVADFLGTEPAGLALVRNATEAAQVVIDAVNPQPGDEIVYTDHVYPWVEAAIQRTCTDRGCVPQRVVVPNHVESPGGDFTDELVARLRQATGVHTALLVIDQITSGSALSLPVEAICAALGDMVPVAVDGAHAPGLIGEPVPSGAAFWFGNLHKWAFSARTAAALVVAPEWRGKVRPMVTSFGGSAGFPGSFTYLGTQDASAYLALPEALSFPERHLGMTFRQLRNRNARVLEAGLRLLADELGLAPGVETDLPMRTLPLGVRGGADAAWNLMGRLRHGGVEVAVSSTDGELHMRLSVQAYVGLRDFAALSGALRDEGIGK